MTSSALLSVELLSLLLPFTEPFAATSARFRHRLTSDDEDTFPRVCELHNTLDLLAESKKPMSHLWDLRGPAVVTEDRGDADDTGNGNKDAEDLLSFMLNSEFVLYELYHEYEVSLNPSLAHWVGICREFDKYTREHAESNAEWGLRERVLKIRAAFVKGILNDQGPNLAKITPKDFAIRGLDFNINLDSFRDALRSQGIYDEQDLEELEREESPTSPASEIFPDSASSRYSQTHSEKTRTPATPSIHQEAAQIASIIFQATNEELPSELTDRLLAHLAIAPELIPSYPLDIVTGSTIAALFAVNPSLTRGIVSLFLTHGSKIQRRELITSLEFLPISLGSLEMINDLVSKTKLLTGEETQHLIHNALSNGVRRAEAMEDGGRGRQAQARLVGLLCLFLRSIIRTEVVAVEDVFYVLQDLGVKFMFVKEARELWRSYCATA
ncbi:hypothetical protein BDD12DRAFT_800421 [Trichophaea hybrida]|nr:hypothetical protein BDD12DRAFT_800421 [Trichophaea hybrida]